MEFLFADYAEPGPPGCSKLDPEEFLAAFDRAMLGVDRRMALRSVPWLFGRATQDREWRAACAEVHALVDRCIDRALDEEAKLAANEGKALERPFSMLHELVKETKDRSFIRDQIISIFFPARDATAIAISDLFFLLARHPAVWKKLRMEVLKNARTLTFENLKSMRYLQIVLRESKFEGC